MLFIVNPIAGRDRAKKIIPIIQETMDKTRFGYRIVTTKGPRDAVSIAQNGIREGYRTIVAVGGDGTINEVAEGILLEGKGRLGIIPGGTGNDFGRTLNIPIDPKDAIELILKGKTKTIDIGSVDGRFFLNVSSVGFDAEIVKNTEIIKKYLKGKFAYTLGVFKTLISYKSKRINIVLDDLKLDMDMLLLAVANGKYYGGGMKISPFSAMDDGYLDICVIKKISKLKLLFIFPSVFNGNHIRHKKYVSFYKAKEVKIQVMDTSYLNVDGEVLNIDQELIFHVDSSKIEVLIT